MDDWHEPSPEAYETVTNPQRFRPLHDAATRLLDNLTATYDVRRRDYRTACPHRDDAEAPAVELTPARPDAGALVVVFTAFPGLHLTVGSWCELALPTCGCDACDEQPEDLIGELHEEVEDLVAERLAERLTHGRQAGYSWGPAAAPEGDWGWIALSPADAAAMGPPGRTDWAAWPRRPAGG